MRSKVPPFYRYSRVMDREEGRLQKTSETQTLEKVSESLKIDLKDDDWEARRKAVLIIQMMCTGDIKNEQVFVQCFEKCCLKPFCNQLNDPRSTVFVDVVETINAMVIKLKNRFPALIRSVLPLLFVSLSVTKKVFSDTANQCIHTIIRNTTFSQVFPLFVEFSSHKHEKIRARVADYVRTCLELYPASEIEESGLLPKLDSVLVACMSDSNPEVRLLGRNSFMKLQSMWPAQAEQLLATLDLPTRKQLESHLQRTRATGTSTDVSSLRSKPAAAPARSTSASVAALRAQERRNMIQEMKMRGKGNNNGNLTVELVVSGSPQRTKLEFAKDSPVPLKVTVTTPLKQSPAVTMREPEFKQTEVKEYTEPSLIKKLFLDGSIATEDDALYCEAPTDPKQEVREAPVRVEPAVPEPSGNPIVDVTPEPEVIAPVTSKLHKTEKNYLVSPSLFSRYMATPPSSKGGTSFGYIQPSLPSPQLSPVAAAPVTTPPPLKSVQGLSFPPELSTTPSFADFLARENLGFTPFTPYKVQPDSMLAVSDPESEVEAEYTALQTPKAHKSIIVDLSVTYSPGSILNLIRMELESNTAFFEENAFAMTPGSDTLSPEIAVETQVEEQPVIETSVGEPEASASVQPETQLIGNTDPTSDVREMTDPISVAISSSPMEQELVTEEQEGPQAPVCKPREIPCETEAVENAVLPENPVTENSPSEIAPPIKLDLQGKYESKPEAKEEMVQAIVELAEDVAAAVEEKEEPIEVKQEKEEENKLFEEREKDEQIDLGSDLSLGIDEDLFSPHDRRFSFNLETSFDSILDGSIFEQLDVRLSLSPAAPSLDSPFKLDGDFRFDLDESLEELKVDLTVSEEDKETREEIVPPQELKEIEMDSTLDEILKKEESDEEKEVFNFSLNESFLEDEKEDHGNEEEKFNFSLNDSFMKDEKEVLESKELHLVLDDSFLIDKEENESETTEKEEGESEEGDELANISSFEADEYEFEAIYGGNVLSPFHPISPGAFLKNSREDREARVSLDSFALDLKAFESLEMAVFTDEEQEEEQKELKEIEAPEVKEAEIEENRTEGEIPSQDEAEVELLEYLAVIDEVSVVEDVPVAALDVCVDAAVEIYLPEIEIAADVALALEIEAETQAEFAVPEPVILGSAPELNMEAIEPEVAKTIEAEVYAEPEAEARVTETEATAEPETIREVEAPIAPQVEATASETTTELEAVEPEVEAEIQPASKPEIEVAAIELEIEAALEPEAEATINPVVESEESVPIEPEVEDASEIDMIKIGVAVEPEVDAAVEPEAKAASEIEAAESGDIQAELVNIANVKPEAEADEEISATEVRVENTFVTETEFDTEANSEVVEPVVELLEALEHSDNKIEAKSSVEAAIEEEIEAPIEAEVQGDFGDIKSELVTVSFSLQEVNDTEQEEISEAPSSVFDIEADVASDEESEAVVEEECFEFDLVSLLQHAKKEQEEQVKEAEIEERREIFEGVEEEEEDAIVEQPEEEEREEEIAEEKDAEEEGVIEKEEAPRRKRKRKEISEEIYLASVKKHLDEQAPKNRVLLTRKQLQSFHAAKPVEEKESEETPEPELEPEPEKRRQRKIVNPLAKAQSLKQHQDAYQILQKGQRRSTKTEKKSVEKDKENESMHPVNEKESFRHRKLANPLNKARSLQRKQQESQIGEPGTVTPIVKHTRARSGNSGSLSAQPSRNTTSRLGREKSNFSLSFSIIN